MEQNTLVKNSMKKLVNKYVLNSERYSAGSQCNVDTGVSTSV